MNYTSILINIFALIGMIVSFGLGYMHGRSVERFKQSENNSDDTKKVYISKEDIEAGLVNEYKGKLSEHDRHVFVEFMAFIDDLPTYSIPDAERSEPNE